MTKEKNEMTNEHNFKVGDRVRSKVAIFATPKGTLGEIVSIAPNGRYKVRLGGADDWFGWYLSKQLELVVTADNIMDFDKD